MGHVRFYNLCDYTIRFKEMLCPYQLDYLTIKKTNNNQFEVLVHHTTNKSRLWTNDVSTHFGFLLKWLSWSFGCGFLSIDSISPYSLVRTHITL
jgi:hypothetical protein